MEKTIRQILAEKMAQRPDDVKGVIEDGPALRRDPSDTALVTDAWLRRRGEEINAQKWTGDRFSDAEIADCFAACFSMCPEPVDLCTDELRHEWFKSLMECPEHAALHAMTQLSDGLAEVGAGSVAREWARYRNEHRRRAEHGEDPQNDLETYRSAFKAAENAASDIEEAQNAIQVIGGCGPCETGVNMDAESMMRIYDRLRNSPKLRGIIEMAGRYQTVARSEQRRKTQHGVDDAVGVTLAGDIGRMTTSEAANLVIPELELDLLRRLQERQVICREYHGVEPAGKGPIVVVVDESGSMDENQKIEHAKAIALAMGWVARHQKRWIAFVGFSGDSVGTRLVMPPNKWDQEALYEWLEHFYGGGTTLDVPIHELPFTYWPEFIQQGMPRGKTDVLLITDAIVGYTTAMADAWNAWREQENARVYGIVIDEPNDTLVPITDRCWRVDVNQLGTDHEAVIESLSV